MTAIVIVLTVQAIVYACHAHQVLALTGVQP